LTDAYAESKDDNVIDSMTWIPTECDELWGFCDQDGNWMLPPQWSYVGCFRANTAPVRSSEGLWGIIDAEGQYLVPCQYPVMSDTYGLVERSPVDFPEGYIGGVDDGFYILESEDGLEGLFCIQTAAHVEPQWDLVVIAGPDEGENELLLVEDEEGWGYVNRQGQVVIPCQYEWAYPFQDGRAVVEYFFDDVYYISVIDVEGNTLSTQREQ
jgi:serine/threonine-protein kinase